MSIALGAVLVEQISREGSSGDQLGCLLTVLEESPFPTTSQRKPQAGRMPHGRLVEAQRIVA